MHSDHILPLLFFKSLSERDGDEVQHIVDELHHRQGLERVVSGDRSLVRFHIPAEHTCPQMRRDSTNLDGLVTGAFPAMGREDHKPETRDRLLASCKRPWGFAR